MLSGIVRCMWVLSPEYLSLYSVIPRLSCSSGHRLACLQQIQLSKCTQLTLDIGGGDTHKFKPNSPVKHSSLLPAGHLAILLCLAVVGYRQHMLYCEGGPLWIPGTAYDTCCSCCQPVVHSYCILLPLPCLYNYNSSCTKPANRIKHNLPQQTHIKFPISIKLAYRQRMLYCEGGPLWIPGTAYDACCGCRQPFGHYCVSCHPCYPN